MELFFHLHQYLSHCWKCSSEIIQKIYLLQIYVGMDILLLVLSFDSIGSVLSSLLLLVIQFVEMTLSQNKFHIIAILPCNFRLTSLRNNIKSATKTNFQSHSVFEQSTWGQFWREKCYHSSNLEKIANCCVVGQVSIFSFYFWRKFEELMIFKSMRIR